VYVTRVIDRQAEIGNSDANPLSDRGVLNCLRPRVQIGSRGQPATNLNGKATTAIAAAVCLNHDTTR
jgi:hypothetical protein